MPDKQKTLTLLTRCLQTEEFAVPVYSKHINNALFFSGISEKEQEKIKKIILTLKKDSETHGKMLNSLIEKIKASEKNVF